MSSQSSSSTPVKSPPINDSTIINNKSTQPNHGSSPNTTLSTHSKTGLRKVSGDGYLIILRHGQSIWNLDHKHPDKDWRYAGSADIPLSTTGVEEALEAAERMKNYRIDFVFTSQLCRATMTAFLALGKHNDRKPVFWYREGETWPGRQNEATLNHVPLVSSKRLNERCFGELEGVLSSQHVTPTRTKEMLKSCRNSYRVPFPGKGGESSHDVFCRVIPYFVKEVIPLLLQGRNVLLVTHGFVVRVLTKFLEEMTDTEFEAEMELEKTAPERCRLLAPTGAPLVYKLADIGKREFVRLEGDDVQELLEEKKKLPFERVAGDLSFELEHSDAPLD
jgi:2,3-bisphosphoglycerate-dependent phosphoglycerate mutase